jgi:hypothetical protein
VIATAAAAERSSSGRTRNNPSPIGPARRRSTQIRKLFIINVLLEEDYCRLIYCLLFYDVIVHMYVCVCVGTFVFLSLSA